MKKAPIESCLKATHFPSEGHGRLILSGLYFGLIVHLEDASIFDLEIRFRAQYSSKHKYDVLGAKGPACKD